MVLNNIDFQNESNSDEMPELSIPGENRQIRKDDTEIDFAGAKIYNS